MCNKGYVTHDWTFLKDENRDLIFLCSRCGCIVNWTQSKMLEEREHEELRLSRQMGQVRPDDSELQQDSLRRSEGKLVKGLRSIGIHRSNESQNNEGIRQ